MTYADKVAQRGEGGKIEFVTPLDIIEEPYIGELMCCKTKLIDFAVTPKHRCLFSNANVSYDEALRISTLHEEESRKHEGKWSQHDTAAILGKPQPYIAKCLKAVKYTDGFAGEVRQAQDIYGKNGLFAKKAYWNKGEKQDKDWMELLGFWFAEGSCTYSPEQRKYRISLTQKKPDNIEYVEGLVERNKHRFKNTFHKYARQGGGYNWELYDIEVASDFKEYGKQTVRSIPKWIKSADIDSMKAFLNGFIVGDGSIDKNGCVKLCTSSPRMADDLHEMCVKVGYIASRKCYRSNAKGAAYQGRIIKKPELYYEVKLSTRRGEYPHVSKKDWYKMDYSGFVYCVTVPSGMVMVRRNGYNMWSGNTDRQVKNIMMPEISRLYYRAKKRGVFLPGRLTAYDIRTGNSEWFLTGFKADENNHESWSGFHAVNTMFVITEASGIADDTFTAIEGNLQGNSRVLLVFNPNRTVGYAAKSQRQPDRWRTFRLNSLTAPNVLQKENVIPGQVDYEWVKDKVDNWCEPIDESEVMEEEDDFLFDGTWYRPSDAFRIKVLGKFPKVAEDILIPQQWIEAAQKRWRNYSQANFDNARIGVDVAGMGRDCSVFCYRYDNFVAKMRKSNAGGRADHMKVAGQVKNDVTAVDGAMAFIDTIGEGAGVYSRCIEQGLESKVYSCKYSQAAKQGNGKPLTDITGQYEFANMRAYLFWAVRDWLDPKNHTGAMLPPGGTLIDEAAEIKWSFRSDGKIIIEKKEEIKNRLGYSPDEFDALANTFYPTDYGFHVSDEELAAMEEDLDY